MTTVLFVQKNSIYKQLNCNCFDEKRNALTYRGKNAIIAHPPCRLWCKLKAFSTAPESEKELARFAVKQIRLRGGVLEHPAGSSLWKDQNLPLPGKYDEHGGTSICVDQFWWGHKARKRTMLYIVGLKIEEIPAVPLRFDSVEFVSSQSKKRTAKKELTKKQRNETPVEFAKWLIKLVKLINNKR